MTTDKPWNGLTRYRAFCEDDDNHMIGYTNDIRGEYYDADDVDALLAERERAFMQTIDTQQTALAAKDERIAEFQLSVEDWKDATGLERGGDPDGVRPDDLRREIAALQPLAEIGRLAVAEREAWQRYNDACDTGDCETDDFLVLNVQAERAVWAAIDAYLASQLDNKETK